MTATKQELEEMAKAMEKTKAKRSRDQKIMMLGSVFFARGLDALEAIEAAEQKQAQAVE
ncbi:hypothetical protein LJB89_03585 [Tyzzerella sp. OttesenSCG-928-J15]|nr:hypothetical protein [Tyzzerella sp. OttesenSCG-928-J15]